MEMEEDIRGSREYSEERDTKDPKRKKKTPLQIEMLERAYAVDTHPSEAVRLELSAKLGLTNRQLQMWFCNRRLKDRKGTRDDLNPCVVQSKEEQFSFSKEPPTFYEYPEAVLASEIEDDALFKRKTRQQVTQESEQHNTELMHKRSKHESEQHITELMHKRSKHENDVATFLKNSVQPKLSDVDLQAAAVAILSSWSEMYREDGPILGFEFDPLPPGAFDLPIESGNYSNVVATLEPHGALSVLQKDVIAGPKAVVSSVKPKVKTVPRDQQIVVLAREQELPNRLGTCLKSRKSKGNMQHAIRVTSGYDRLDIGGSQYMQGASKRPSGMIPVPSRDTLLPKMLPSPAKTLYMKQEAYGFEDRFRKGDESCLFPTKNVMASSNESIVSFIKKHEVSAYRKQDNVDCNVKNGAWLGVSDDCCSSEDSDTELKQFGIKQVTRKGMIRSKEGYGYEQFRGQGCIRRNSEETDESTGLIESDESEELSV